jgi:hypothetical protein
LVPHLQHGTTETKKLIKKAHSSPKDSWPRYDCTSSGDIATCAGRGTTVMALLPSKPERNINEVVAGQIVNYFLVFFLPLSSGVMPGTLKSQTE